MSRRRLEVMNDLELRIRQLENLLHRTRLEAEFAYDRENLAHSNHEQIFLMFKALADASNLEQKYAILINSLKKIIYFEQVVLLSRSLDTPDKIDVIYASHPALARHNWQCQGEILRALDDEIIVLNDPSIVPGFKSEDSGFIHLTRSVILLPLLLQGSQLLFVCTHHLPLTFDLFIKKNIRVFQSVFAHAVMNIEYRTQLEEAVKHRTHELIEYQEKLRSFRRLSNENFWYTDKDLKFIPLPLEGLDSSDKQKNYFDYKNLIGKHLYSIFDEKLLTKTPQLLERLKEQTNSHAVLREIELPIKSMRGVFWGRVTAEPVFTDNGEFLGYRGTILDVTREFQQTLDLQKARDGAEIANRSKSEYLAVMSHEIKTPLQAILGMLDLLEQTNIDETQRSYIKHVSQSASLLQTILHDVLDLSKIESQAMVLENISFDIKFAINSAIIQMQERAEAKGIELKCKISDNFPQMIVGDQHRLSQILFNLINNAIKFTKEGSVVVTAERYENRLKFQVKDTGTGIPSEHLEDLFKPFVQLDGSITRKFGGTGLGLAICKRLVEHMGGKIGIKSVLGKGSTFWFEIPCKVPTTTIIGAKAIRKAVVHKERHYNILLVEDSQINQFVIKTMLEKLGHKIMLANNGIEAIEKVKEQKPDLILMDLHMPVMDGIEATKHIMTEIAPFPIVALTANSSDEERIKCRKVGMVSMASKPVTTQTLKKLLEDLEDVIEEANDNVAKGATFTLSDDAKDTELNDSGNTNYEATMGAVSSLGRSNAALIDALIKNQLSSSEKSDHQRTKTYDKE